MLLAVVALVVFVLLFGGCATTGGPTAADWDRCESKRVIDACNPADYPPLTEILPKSAPGMTPPPQLFVPLPEGDRK